MAKSKNHTSHTDNFKAHRNGIKSAPREKYTALKGVRGMLFFSCYFALLRFFAFERSIKWFLLCSRALCFILTFPVGPCLGAVFDPDPVPVVVVVVVVAVDIISRIGALSLSFFFFFCLKNQITTFGAHPCR
jgi:hypothetical protein